MTTLALSIALVLKPDFGLRTGNVWEYTMKHEQSVSKFKETASQFVAAGKHRVLEIKTEHEAGHVSYKYLGLDERGLLSFYNSQKNGPGVDAGLTPVVLAQMPYKKGLAWKWVEPFRGGTVGKVSAEDLRKLDRQMSAVVFGEEETITVPAGTYKTLHIRVTSESEGRGRSFEDHWYAFDVGLVKSTYETPEGKHEVLLSKFTPGT